MPSETNRSIAPPLQAKPKDYAYDLVEALRAVVRLVAEVPAGAMTADIFGTRRSGSGTRIGNDGFVLTASNLVIDAATVTLQADDGRGIPGEIVGCDHDSGFAVLRCAVNAGLPSLALGSSAGTRVSEHVVVAAAGGVGHALAARISNKQPFAGHWEYALDEAILTSPAHPRCMGAAVIGRDGALIGIAAMELLRARPHGPKEQHNLVIPIDLLTPVLDDLVSLGRPRRPARPWLGLYAIEIERRAIVADLAPNGPAQVAGLLKADAITAVDGVALSGDTGERVGELFRHVWAMGQAGTEVPLTVLRDGRTKEVRVKSGDRGKRRAVSLLH